MVYIPSGYVHHGGGRVRSCSPGKKTTRSNYQNKVDEVEAVVVKLKENTRECIRKRKYECGDTSFKWGNMHHMMDPPNLPFFRKDKKSVASSCNPTENVPTNPSQGGIT